MKYKNSSIWIYPWDLLDEGIASTVDKLSQNPGIDWLSVTAVYHSGKFLLPHNPKKKVYFPKPGTLYFQPSKDWYGKIRFKPPIWEELDESPNFWGELKSAAEDKGIRLAAWTLGLHNSWLASNYPDCAIENVYGDNIITDLCPNNPDVQDYICAIVRDISENLPVEKILIESLEYMPFTHGFHHEVIGVPMTATANYLMSMCFCSHCTKKTETAGLNRVAIKNWVKQTLDSHFLNPYSDVRQTGWPDIVDQLDGEIGRYIDSRAESISDLSYKALGKVKESGKQQLGLCDFGPLYQLGPNKMSWESGTDLSTLAELYDEICPTFYFTDQEVLRNKIDEYLSLVNDLKIDLAPAIRAILPQVGKPEDLQSFFHLINNRVDGVSFYNYGFSTDEVLKWFKTEITSFSLREK